MRYEGSLELDCLRTISTQFENGEKRGRQYICTQPKQVNEEVLNSKMNQPSISKITEIILHLTFCEQYLPNADLLATTRIITRVSVFRIELDDVYALKHRLMTPQLQYKDKFRPCPSLSWHEQLDRCFCNMVNPRACS